MTGGVAPFIDAVANNPPPGPEYQSQVDKVEVSGNIATASLCEQAFLGLNFVNLFQLLNNGSQWLIVAKLFESE